MPQNLSHEIDRENPWPGLSSFTEETRGFFFGRDKETDELSRLVRRETLTVLFGQSGLGKSSLLQAGLFPLLRENDHLPLYLRLDHSLGDAAPSPRSPEAAARAPQPQVGLADQVKAALIAAFAAAKADAPPLRPEESLWEYFHRKDVDIWSAKNRLLTPVLAFDQFEEIFTLGRADDARRERSRAFLAEIADLVENRPPAALREKFDRGEAEPARYNYDKPSCRVILSLREDFLPDLEGLRQELPALIHNRLRLKRLNGAQALEAVARPAPHLLAEGVGEKIVEFVSGARGGSAERLLEMEVEPALLSVICRELNERRRTLGQDKITADLVSGNRREILNDFYERSVADLPEAMRAFVEDHLLTKSGFRDNLALETALEYPGVTRPLIDTLVARRLLRIEERAGIQRVELTHDVLADVVRASRDSRQQRLAVIETARKAQRMRYAIAGLVAAVVVLSIGAIFGIRAQRQATAQASHTDLVLGSRLLDENKVGEGLAYLVRAGQKDPENPLIGPRLLSTLTARNFVMPFGTPLRLPVASFGGGFSSDGKWIGVLGEDDVIRIVDVAAWRIERELAFEQKVRRGGVAVAEKNDSVFAVMLLDGSMLVCDAGTSRPRLPPIKPPQPMGERSVNFALSPDGRWLAASNGVNAWIWDTSNGQLQATVPNNYGNRTIRFSPDSRRFVTSHGDRLVQMWSLPDGQPVGRTMSDSRTPYIYDKKFSGDGKRIMVWTGGGGGGVHLCDAETGEPIRPPIPVNSSAIWDMWITHDGRRIVYTADDRTVNVLDVESGKPAYPPLAHGGLVISVELRRDDRLLFTNSVDGLFRLWDFETGRLLAEPTWKQEQFTPATLSRDGTTVVVFSNTGAVHRLRLGQGPAEPLVMPRPPNTTAFVNFMATSPARLYWLTPTEVKVFDIASGRIVDGGFTFPAPIPGQGGAMRSGYGDTLEAGQILVPRVQGEMRAWTWGEKGITNDVKLEDAPSRTGGFTQNPHGRLVVAIGGPEGRDVMTWNTRTGKRQTTITLERAGGNAHLSPDEARIAIRTPSDSVIHIHDVVSGKPISRLELEGRAQLTGFRFNATGDQLITGDSWGGVQVWDVPTGRQLQSKPVHRAVVTRFEYSPDGKYYASLSIDGSVQVWDSARHTPVGEMLSLNGRAGRATFSPSAKQIATPSSGGMARIWDIGSGLPLNEPMDHRGEAVGITAYSPDGAFVSATTDSTGAATRYNFVWPAPPDGRGARTPKWLLQLATIAAGRYVTTEGKFKPAIEEFDRIEEIRREIDAAPSSDPYAAWARWMLSDSPTRSIAPRFTITPAEAKKLREELMKLPVMPPSGTTTAAP